MLRFVQNHSLEYYRFFCCQCGTHAKFSLSIVSWPDLSFNFCKAEEFDVVKEYGLAWISSGCLIIAVGKRIFRRCLTRCLQYRYVRKMTVLDMISGFRLLH